MLTLASFLGGVPALEVCLADALEQFPDKPLDLKREQLAPGASYTVVSV
jgi:hypothetical protein